MRRLCLAHQVAQLHSGGGGRSCRDLSVLRPPNSTAGAGDVSAENKAREGVTFHGLRRLCMLRSVWIESTRLERSARDMREIFNRDVLFSGDPSWNILQEWSDSRMA